MNDLIAKAEALTGPDRGMDRELWRLEWNAASPQMTLDMILPHWTAAQIEELCPHYTASIDAAVALVERCLPGWRHSYEKRTTGDVLAWVSDTDDGPCFPSVSATPALALVAALLRAMAAKEGMLP